MKKITAVILLSFFQLPCTVKRLMPMQPYKAIQISPSAVIFTVISPSISVAVFMMVSGLMNR